ncbi:MAG: dTDP-4-dehydrorhamnose 3,5-epimerase [Alphaproteobacteria bacterium]|nr:dTDP-4-dehydrorhamnose 3,5-epimerase [Alphaproteobacteria bacterium]
MVLRPPVYEDERGYFSPNFNANALHELGIRTEFVQDNQSLSVNAGTVRGLHAQLPPFEQAKIVRVLAGRILDVIVDARRSSASFGQWESYELSADSHEQVFVPRGCLHGFITLEPNTVVTYKVDNQYAPDHQVSVAWNDPDLGISWPQLSAPITLSEKDQTGLSWADFKTRL